MSSSSSTTTTILKQRTLPEKDGEGEEQKKDSKQVESDEDSTELNDNNDLETEDSPNEEVTFPDTVVKFDALAGNLESSNKSEKSKLENTEVIIKQHRKKVPTEQSTSDKNTDTSQTVPSKPPGPKRGQRGKLKKIKEKYKHQDEEERELRMKILASAGQARKDKKGGKKDKKSSKDTHHKPLSQNRQQGNPKKPVLFIEKSEKEDITVIEDRSIIPPESDAVPKVQEPDVSDDEDETQETEELQLLNSLTGCPIAEDTLLYAVPVCGPYTAMLSYKYKIKMIPGSNRRGKAAKTALQIFMHEKMANQREKDLLRSVKDQDISRNLPGKVKISAPNYKKAK